MKKILIAGNVILAITFALAFNFAYLHAARERNAYEAVNILAASSEAFKGT